MKISVFYILFIILMKKLLSLLAILGLLGFVALPSYAQEEDVVSDEAPVVAEAEDIETGDAEAEEFVVVDENDYDTDWYSNYEEPEYTYNYWVNGDGYAIETAEQEIADALNNLTEEDLAWIMVLLWGFWLFALIRGYCCYVFAVLQPISKWEIYRKAGKKGWAFLVPFWGSMVYSEIGGINKWVWLLPWITWIFGFCAWIMSGKVYGIIMFILVLASLVWWIVSTYRIARKYWWGEAASVMHVLFTPITTLILGLWNYKYEGKSK